jgi:hypothetical protein
MTLDPEYVSVFRFGDGPLKRTVPKIVPSLLESTPSICYTSNVQIRNTEKGKLAVMLGRPSIP